MPDRIKITWKGETEKNKSPYGPLEINKNIIHPGFACDIDFGGGNKITPPIGKFDKKTGNALTAFYNYLLKNCSYLEVL